MVYTEESPLTQKYYDAIKALCKDFDGNSKLAVKA